MLQGSFNGKELGQIGTSLLMTFFVVIILPISIILDPFLKVFGKKGCIEIQGDELSIELTAESFKKA